ncbi:MAG TPA: peptidase [Polyangia bacterium]|nr:peptidase [Polyangia bacterium]
MTYCVGVLLEDGIVLGSDSRTHAGVDDFASFCKMTVFETPGERVLVLLSSGSLAGTQAVIGVLTQQPDDAGIRSARTMFDVARVVSDAMRAVDRRDSEHLEKHDLSFNASFILGGQIRGERMRLFRIYAAGNFIEAGADTPFFQTGEAKYGKPIIDRVITPATSLSDAAKCVLVSFDSTMRSNLSVGMPIDLLCYGRDALVVKKRRRFEQGDPYFDALSKKWSEGVRAAFKELPEPQWGA